MVHNVSTVQVAGVSQVTRAPDRFAPSAGGTTTITVTAVAGMNLEARFVSNQTNAVARVLPLSGVGTTYSGLWDGRDAVGALAPVATYRVLIFSVAGPHHYAPETSVQLTIGVTSVAVSPNPFVPTGSNSTTITVDGTPGQAGLTVGFNGSCDQRLPLVETTPGRYTAAWTAVGRQFSGVCAPMRIYSNSTQTIEVHDGAGQLVHNVSTVQVAGVSQVTRAPDRFAPSAGGTTTITVTAVAGMNLEARFVSNQTNAVARVLPLSGVGTTYSGLWDGRDAVGALAPVATYRVLIFSVAGPHHYAPETSVQSDRSA